MSEENPRTQENSVGSLNVWKNNDSDVKKMVGILETPEQDEQGEASEKYPLTKVPWTTEVHWNLEHTEEEVDDRDRFKKRLQR